MYDVVVKKFTFAVSSRDELLVSERDVSSRSLYVIARPSVVCLSSVCLSSVTLVHPTQSCKAFIGLTIRAKMIGGGRPLKRKFCIK